jgi:serine/threonine protein kinase
VIQLDDCPSENEIVEFLDGALAESERARIEAHCAGCERCREGLADAAHDAATPAGEPADGAAGQLRSEIESAVLGVLDETTGAEAAVGKRIGRFEIVAVQGRGQFGVVYRARDTQLGRLVAVKVMRRTRWRDATMREALFHTEAAAATRLQHPNIVTLHDHGEFEGAPYLILELLEGETLRSRLARDGQLAPRDAVAIAADVARALVEAHAAGVIHRDIKPGNVFLCTSGQTKVLDLGLAQLHTEVGAPATPTDAMRAGTPLYMAPELFRGHPADACTDVYAVGVTLREAVAGSRPDGPRIAGARIPRPVRRLLAKAIAVDRADRFHDAGELLAALTGVQRQLAGRGPAARRVGLALGGALVAGAAVAAYHAAPSRPMARPAVAVLGFDNLSGRDDLAWLSTALSEILDAELAASPAVRVVSDEAVRHARADLDVLRWQVLRGRHILLRRQQVLPERWTWCPRLSRPVTGRSRCAGYGAAASAPRRSRRGRPPPLPLALRRDRSSSGLMNWPVWLVATRATCSGVPVAITSPPAEPPSGPRSMIQSAVLMTSRLCSMTSTVLPPSTRRCRTSSSFLTSPKCRPVVGSSSRYSVRPVWTRASSRASLTRWASPPDSVVAGWPSAM